MAGECSAMREYLKFEWWILREAFRSSTAYFNKHIFFEIVFSIMAVFAVYFIDPHEFFQGIRGAILTVVIATALMFLSIFVVSLISRPYKFWKNDQKKIKGLERATPKSSRAFRPNMSVLKAVLYIQEQSIFGKQIPDEYEGMIKAENALRQAALDNCVQVWGKEQISDTPGFEFSDMDTEIQAGFWQKMEIRSEAALDETAINQVETCLELRRPEDLSANAIRGFTNLHVNDEQIYQFWPKDKIEG